MLRLCVEPPPGVQTKATPRAPPSRVGKRATRHTARQDAATAQKSTSYRHAHAANRQPANTHQTLLPYRRATYSSSATLRALLALLVAAALSAPALAAPKRRRNKNKPPPLHKKKRCLDTCARASDGRCDDGSGLLAAPNSSKSVALLCELGTDCADCGFIPRRVAPHPPLRRVMPAAPDNLHEPAAASDASGVELLRARGIEVNLAWTKTEPHFLMPFTDPRADTDVSANMASKRVVEPFYNLYFQKLSQSCCARGGLMLDVGANFGYYSILAAKMGCRVVAWEPIPVFRAFLQTAARLNHVSHKIHVRDTVVSDVAGATINLTVPTRGYWGTASVGGLNIEPAIKAPAYNVSATSETLDQVVREQACVMKLDVEGHEPSVLRGGASRFLKDYAPRAILTEYTPGVLERAHARGGLVEYPRSLRRLHDAGYALWHLAGARKGTQVEALRRRPTLPSLPRISRRTIAAEELTAVNMARPGFAMPWDLHPHALHAEFSHNTDMILSLDKDAIPDEREVGLWAEAPFGLGGGLCRDTLKVGTVHEMVGRLCVVENRSATISRAAKIAEAAAQGGAREHVSLWHDRVGAEGRRWSIQGLVGSRARELVRKDRKG